MTTRTRILSLVFIAVVASLGTLIAQAPKKPAIAYPNDFRHWRQVKSMVIYGSQNKLLDRFGGLHNVSASDFWLVNSGTGRTVRRGEAGFLGVPLFQVLSCQGAPIPGRVGAVVFHAASVCPHHDAGVTCLGALPAADGGNCGAWPAPH